MQENQRQRINRKQNRSTQSNINIFVLNHKLVFC
jgi:hypothetical protein